MKHSVNERVQPHPERKKGAPPIQEPERPFARSGTPRAENTTANRQTRALLLDGALSLAADGLAVFPLVPEGKAPLTRSGFYDATTDHDRIHRWWKLQPKANVGLPVPSGHLVLDLDLYNDAADTLTALEKRLGELPDTLTVETGGGGLHLWFAVPADATFRGRAGQGIDLKAAGRGYVVAPPSVHASGKRYVWRDEEAEAVELPEAWLLDLAGPEQPVGRDRVLASAANANANAPIEGDELAWLASLPGGRPDFAMEAALDRYNLAARMRASAHDTLRDKLFRVLSLGNEGHAGAAVAAEAILVAFAAEHVRRWDEGELSRARDEFTLDREVARAFEGAVAKIRCRK